MDGGVSDSTPISRAVEHGHPRNLAVLARYAVLHTAMLRRQAAYRASLDLGASMERAGSAFVLRPVRPLVVGRMERDLTRLEALFRQGHDETMARMAGLEAWLHGQPGCGRAKPGSPSPSASL